MKQRLNLLLPLLFVTAVALAFRLPRLRDRPMHADEAVQAARFRELWHDGRFVYDPDEFHGPTLPYATLPSAWLSGAATFAEANELTYRIVPVLFGAGVILLLGLLADAMGRAATMSAGVVAAISPAMVFYSRYYIHETLLIFFTLAAIATGWRYARSGKLAWVMATGACLGLMQATKETSVIAFGAMGCALMLASLWSRLLGEHSPDGWPKRRPGHLALALTCGILVAVTLLSSLFTNAHGPLDGVLTYFPWLQRAGGASPHVQPWYYYLHILVFWQRGDGRCWSEGAILALAAAGIVLALLPMRKTGLTGAGLAFARWASFYTLILTAVYSAIPYKTPWCLLGFLQGMILLAGVGVAGLVGAVLMWTNILLAHVGGAGLVRTVLTWTIKGLATLALAAAAAHLAWQSYRASYVEFADPNNPYVYAHTLPDVYRLSDDVSQLSQAAPGGNRLLVKVIWHDPYYWPLPWYFRQFKNVGYWTQVPDDPAAHVVVSSPKLDAALTEKLDATHLMTGYYGVRPNVLAQLWVRMDLWEAHLRRTGRL